MAIDRKALGKRIQQHRKHLGLTQATTAEKAGLDPTYLSQVERGQKMLSLEALDRVAKVLKVTPGGLLDDDKTVKDDALLREVREVLSHWTVKQRRAVLKALRALADL